MSCPRSFASASRSLRRWSPTSLGTLPQQHPHRVPRRRSHQHRHLLHLPHPSGQHVPQLERLAFGGEERRSRLPACQRVGSSPSTRRDVLEVEVPQILDRQTAGTARLLVEGTTPVGGPSIGELGPPEPSPLQLESHTCSLTAAAV